METLAVVSMSGGKDSTATALRAIETFGPSHVRLVLADTGNEHDLTMEYALDYLPTALGIPVNVVRADFTKRIENKRVYVQEKWPGKGVPQHIIDTALAILHPTGNPFLDLCLWKGRVPSRKAQFCTQELKRYPLDNYTFDLMSQGYRIESWRGIRREESQNRKDAKDREETPEGWTIVHPIASWTAQQVIDYVLSKGVKLNPLYSQGMGRVGCMPCINCNKDELLEIARRFPEHIERIRQWEELIGKACKRGFATWFSGSAEEGDTDADIFDRFNIVERVEWAKTARGGRQFDFVRNEPHQECSSVYGLCE
jgi:3'-phosphoadenosine 5'-phosphosulfate sulfotransferase (PAPS reductase)/FAD synthetase